MQLSIAYVCNKSRKNGNARIMQFSLHICTKKNFEKCQKYIWSSFCAYMEQIVKECHICAHICSCSCIYEEMELTQAVRRLSYVCYLSGVPYTFALAS